MNLNATLVLKNWLSLFLAWGVDFHKLMNMLSIEMKYPKTPCATLFEMESKMMRKFSCKKQKAQQQKRKKELDLLLLGIIPYIYLFIFFLKKEEHL